jgi:signal transduction histidine kinase
LIFALVIAIVGTVIFSDRRTINAFNRIWSRLENFIEDCTNLLAAVSHDLRSPVTSLRLRAELQTIIETTLIFRTKKPGVSAPASQT